MVEPPSYATLILIAVVTLVAIGVALWVSSITLHELGHLEMIDICTDTSISSDSYHVILCIKNRGLEEVSVITILVNGLIYTDAGVTITPQPENTPIKPGKEVIFTVILPYNRFKPSQSVAITVKLSTGNEYKVLLRLP